MFETAVWIILFVGSFVLIYGKELFIWFLLKTGRLKKKCEHKRFVRKQSFGKDGTPLYYFNCWDCGYNVQTHVHGDPEQMKKDGWEKEEHGEGEL